MIAHILKVLLICLEVLLIFNLLIVVHELGHFLAARWRGLVVEKFGIWFGKPIWKKTINGVQYSLGCIPAGGFVALPQLAPMEAMEGESDIDRSQLPPVSVLDKIIVAAAGPVFSLGLAFAFACIVWAIGRPVGEAEKTTVVGYVLADGPAAKAGMQPGDRILSVDGKPVENFGGMGSVGTSIMWNIARSEEAIIPIVVDRTGKQMTLQVEPTVPPREGWGRRNLKQISILPSQSLLIADVQKNSPAEEVGLKSGDVVTAVNGQKLWSTIALGEYLKVNPDKPVTLTTDRDGKVSEITVSPRILSTSKDDTTPRIGILWDLDGKSTIVHPNPFRQIVDSVTTMWQTISAVFSPKSGVKPQHLSGPVGIMRLYYMLFEKPDGWKLALWFSVVFNVNLALLNLLPIPVLDGGHILLAIIEGIRRRPINVRVLEIVQSGFAILIIGFMIYVTFFDLQDLPFLRKESAPAAEATPAKK